MCPCFKFCFTGVLLWSSSCPARCGDTRTSHTSRRPGSRKVCSKFFICLYFILYFICIFPQKDRSEPPPCSKLFKEQKAATNEANSSFLSAACVLRARQPETDRTISTTIGDNSQMLHNDIPDQTQCGLTKSNRADLDLRAPDFTGDTETHAPGQLNNIDHNSSELVSKDEGEICTRTTLNNVHPKNVNSGRISGGKAIRGKRRKLKGSEHIACKNIADYFR
jgi:hypothetical protein